MQQIWESRLLSKSFKSQPSVMGVQWNLSLVGENCGDSARLVNMDTFGTPMANLLDAIEDKAEEDKALDDAN